MLLSIIYGGVQVLYHSPDEQLHRILKCVEDSIIERVYVIDNIISRKSGQKIPKIANLQYYKSKANYGTKKKGISR